MLGLTANWKPDTNNPGTFPRTGNAYYAFWSWDPHGSFDGTNGTFTESGKVNFNQLLCGSSLGAPAASC